MAVAVHLIAPIAYGIPAESYTPLTLWISSHKLGDFNECADMVMENQTGGRDMPYATPEMATLPARRGPFHPNH